MATMALSNPVVDEMNQPMRSHSTRNRHFSVYDSQIKNHDNPAAADPPMHKVHTNPYQPPELPAHLPQAPQVPQIPPIAISPRWDSLGNGSRSAPQSPTSARFPPPPETRQAPYLYNAAPPYQTPRGRRSDGRNEPPPPRTLSSKTSLQDMRSPDSANSMKNFSRPRQPGMRTPSAEAPRSRAPPPNVPPRDQMTLPFNHVSSQPNPRRRPPPLSGSSWKSAASYALPAYPPPPNVDASDSRRPRSRNTPNQSPTASSPFSHGQLGSPASPPGAGAPMPWIDNEEPRSSFRSQMTTSSAPGNSHTERSSVMTKESSVTSVSANADEPSLEDLMGLYEKGFSDDLSDDEGAETHQIIANTEPESHRVVVEPPQDVPPVPSLPTEPLRPLGETTKDIDAMSSLAAPPSLDAEIRRSKLIFFSPDFTAAVPHLAANMERNGTEKRDSGKSLESDPSVHSQPAAGVANNHNSESDKDFGPVSPPILEPFSMSPVESKPMQLLRTETLSTDPQTPTTESSPPASPAVSLPVESEEPGSRDRYGFKKQNQYITRQQYDEWNKNYSQYLARRKKKWAAYLKDNALMTDRPNRFPAPNAKTKRFVRKGIPPEWRGAAWFYYAGGPAILAKHSGLYDKLLYKKAKSIDIEAIERDLHRTFPDNVSFRPIAGVVANSQPGEGRFSSDSSGAETPSQPDKETPMIASLRRVLRAFAVYNPHIGYCQSLNFLAGLLLLFVDTEEKCFWLLNVITHIYLPGTHEMSLEGSKVDLSVLMTELQETMPAVWDKIGSELEPGQGSRPTHSKSLRKAKSKIFRRDDNTVVSSERLPPITLCMTSWFMSCFIGTLPIETTLRVWDIFFYEGSKTLFRVAMGIFKNGESEIKAVSDPMEMFGVVQAMPRRMIDANQLIERCFLKRGAFNHLTQDAIDGKRQEKREKAHQEREEQKGTIVRPQTSGNATATAGDSGVGRKGTLFSRKRREVSRTHTTEV